MRLRSPTFYALDLSQAHVWRLSVLGATIFLCLLAPSAGAHAIHGAPVEGRLPGQPDFDRIGNKTFRFIPGKGEYEVRQPGRPIAFAHTDPLPRDGEGLAGLNEAAAVGAWVGLPTSELEPTCRSQGSRIALVYTHRPFIWDPIAPGKIRSIARRMNWKLNSQASQSSGGSRTLKMIVDCTGATINVHDVTTSTNTFSTVSAAVQEQLDGKLGGPIKYLVFDAGTAGETGGIASVVDDNRKSWINSNALYTSVALAYNIGGWATHAPLHELLHAMGASQGNEAPPAPFSTPAYHCSDGIDVLCYADGTGSYSETSCPESAGYGTPVNVPIDCNYDTYFDAAEKPGSWLSEYWNAGGYENPFLSGPPRAVTQPALNEGATWASVEGEIDSGGYDTTYYAEYGTSTSYGSVASGGVVAGPEPEMPVGIEIGGLQPSTTYHYRVVATNSAGTSHGSDRTFTTVTAPPVAITEPASGENDSGATLRGKVNPEGQGTTYQFEVGTTIAYGQKVPVPAASAGSGIALVEVSKPISGLVKGVTYHYRLTAANATGTTFGEDKTFVARKVTEFPLPSGGRPKKLTLGPDGNMWFTATNPARIGKITAMGAVTEYFLAEGSPWGIAAGPDGNLWFSNQAKGRIGKITTAGTITEYPTPTKFAGPMGMTVGPDGNLWAAEQSVHKIAEITTAGAITEYALPNQPVFRYPLSITSGPDGNLWYTSTSGRIGKMSTSGALLAEYVTPAFTPSPRDITQGPDGKLWYTSGSYSAIGKITTAGAITWYPVSSYGNSIAAGPDGNLWFTMFETKKVARVTTSGAVTEYPVASEPEGIAMGPDGKLWFALSGGAIGRISP